MSVVRFRVFSDSLVLFREICESLNTSRQSAHTMAIGEKTPLRRILLSRQEFRWAPA
jgi:hypothetical protein